MHKQLIINTCKHYGLLRNQTAYVLATAEWETNRTFQPVKEAYWLSEEWRRNNLRYYPWYGRGFVQLTWEENYRKAGEKIGVNLIARPDLAMEPNNSAKILVLGMKEGWFTGKKLSDFITINRSDFYNARRIVNGLDKAKEIEQIAKKYDKELLALGYGVDRTPPEWTEKPVQEGKSSPKGIAIVAIVIAILAASVFIFLN